MTEEKKTRKFHYHAGQGGTLHLPVKIGPHLAQTLPGFKSRAEKALNERLGLQGQVDTIEEELRIEAEDQENAGKVRKQIDSMLDAYDAEELLSIAELLETGGLTEKDHDKRKSAGNTDRTILLNEDRRRAFTEGPETT